MNLKVVFLIIFTLIVYFFVIFCVFNTRKTKILKFSPFPKLFLKKKGVTFFSKKTHRIKIDNVNTMFVENVLYIKSNNRLVLINNVSEVKICENYLYFTALGKVRILFACDDFYKYFSLNIDSKQFNLHELKQQAILDLLNNNFNLNLSKTTKRYIKIINNVLNIEIFSKKIIIKPNNYKFSFVLTYKLNNKIKRVYVNQKI